MGMGCVMGIGERYKDNPAQQFPAQMLYSYRTMWAVLEKIPACPDIQYIGVQVQYTVHCIHTEHCTLLASKHLNMVNISLLQRKAYFLQAVF